MNVVIDASAAIGVVLAMPGSDTFSTILEQADMVSAPDLYIVEISNALWRYRKSDLLPMAHCERALAQAVALPDRFEPGGALYLEAFTLACRHLHPVYDAMYLVLARRNSSIILTMDHRLAALAEKLGIEVVTSTKS